METDSLQISHPERWAWGGAALIVAATAAVYLSSLTNGFIGMDDDVYVTANPLIRSLAPANLWAILTRSYAEFYHPVTLLSLASDYAIWGLNPFGYHLTDFLLHAINTALVFWICHALVLLAAESATSTPDSEPPDRPSATGHPQRHRAFARTAALIAAALFGLHPLHVESVAWAAQRKDLLCSLFYLLALGCYVRHAVAAMPNTAADMESSIQNPKSKIQNRTWYRLSLAAFVASLLSKSMGVTLPVVLLLVDYYPLRRLRAWPARRMAAGERAVWIEKLPFFGLAFAAVIATLAAQAQGGALRSSAEIPWSLRPWIVLHSYAFYLWRSIVPTDLTVLYQLPHVGAHNILSWLSLTVLAVITVIAWLLRRPFPVLAAGWIFYVITLAPVCGLLSFGAQSCADRYSYLPLLGPFLVVAAGIARVNLIGDRGWRPVLRAATGAAVGFALFFLAARTQSQIATWHNGESVWRHHLQIDPGHPRARFNLAHSYQTQGRIDAAMREYERCLETAPRDFNANTNYGSLLLRRGDAQGATAHFERALAACPDKAAVRVRAGAHLNLGLALARAGDDDKAIEHFTRVLALDPRVAGAHAEMGDAHARAGRVGLAIRHYTKALAIDPRMAQVHENLGRAWLAVGEPAKAQKEFGRTLDLRPRSPDALIELALLDAAASRPMTAIDRLCEAARYRSRDPEIRMETARIARAWNALGLAQSFLEAAIAIDSDHVEAHMQLGALLEQRKRHAKALETFLKARAIFERQGEPVPDHLEEAIRRVQDRLKSPEAKDPGRNRQEGPATGRKSPAP